ncbi:MAG: hypothetical protein JWN24_651 [Phycisphaerales bacterium]|nr:hypothetical protein [Phycisphaerales bacterium]
MKGISARIFKSRRTPESSARCGRCIVEPLECRRLLTNTLQITIPAQVTSITAKDLQNVGIQFQLRDLPGTLTLTGENLAAQTVGKNVTVTGNVSRIDDLSVFNTTPASSLMVKGPAGAIPLVSFESTGPMKMIDIHPFLIDGPVNIVAAPKMQFGDGMASTINITQNIPLVNFTGGSFSNSQINFIKGNSAPSIPAVMIKLNNLTDTQLNADGFIKMLNLHSITESAPGASGITANSAGMFKVSADYKANFTLKPTFGLRYTLNSYAIGGTASGTWNIPGTTRMGSANTYDSGYSAKFDSIGTYLVTKDFSGSLTAGAIGNASIGRNMVGGTFNLTNPFAANSWNLGSLKVSNSIENSTITSQGNLGNIQTMFTYYSHIQAGINPNYVFGQPPTTDWYTSNSSIKSFISDCPSHHKIHFVGSYVGAYDLQSILIGNVQDQNFGSPFGVAGVRIDKYSVLLNNKLFKLSGLNSLAGYDSGLQKYGLTEQDLVDFRTLFLNGG